MTVYTMALNASIAFLTGTAFFAWISRRSILNPRSHGFYRFIAWECMLGLVLVNLPTWGIDPYGPLQLVSWALQLVSLALVAHAIHLLVRFGRPSETRGEAELFLFERTSTLVTKGIYRYIRHPMYAALLFFAWGIFLKGISLPSIALVCGASAALFVAALRDEAECLSHFGEAYAYYMKSNKRFIPFVL
jgi:protein-S-isoprenylcysteine O-methyltransferase Ste14